MGAIYQIVVNMRGTNGMWELGRFFIGDDRYVAFETFGELEGTSFIPSPIRLDLIQKGEEIDIVLVNKGCTLNQFEKNCRIIARDAFKLFNLEQ
ncbi:MAG TPA: hypothetical protein VGG71_00125 [Chitinophagaceae bacterium]|jgi:hypothetical protein